MIFRTSQMQYRFKEGGLDLRHRVHAAGAFPNDMNPFLSPNKQEVLFVN
jgi:hypothetical protein